MATWGFPILRNLSDYIYIHIIIYIYTLYVILMDCPQWEVFGPNWQATTLTAWIWSCWATPPRRSRRPSRPPRCWTEGLPESVQLEGRGELAIKHLGFLWDFIDLMRICFSGILFICFFRIYMEIIGNQMGGALGYLEFSMYPLVIQHGCRKVPGGYTPW